MRLAHSMVYWSHDDGDAGLFCIVYHMIAWMIPRGRRSERIELLARYALGTARDRGGHLQCNDCHVWL